MKSTTAMWILAGLLCTTVMLLNFVPIVESASTEPPHLIPTTLFQHSDIPGPSNHIVKGILYTTGVVLSLVAAISLPRLSGVMIIALVFSLLVFVTTGSVRGLVGGWVMLPAWLLLAASTTISGALLWVKLIEWQDNRKANNPAHPSSQGSQGGR